MISSIFRSVVVGILSIAVLAYGDGDYNNQEYDEQYDHHRRLMPVECPVTQFPVYLNLAFTGPIDLYWDIIDSMNVFDLTATSDTQLSTSPTTYTDHIEVLCLNATETYTLDWGTSFFGGPQVTLYVYFENALIWCVHRSTHLHVLFLKCFPSFLSFLPSFLHRFFSVLLYSRAENLVNFYFEVGEAGESARRTRNRRGLKSAKSGKSGKSSKGSTAVDMVSLSSYMDDAGGTTDNPGAMFTFTAGAITSGGVTDADGNLVLQVTPSPTSAPSMTSSPSAAKSTKSPKTNKSSKAPKRRERTRRRVLEA